MKERPILFSAPMVRAILDGRKTVTRRPDKRGKAPCEPGDVLWVRETWGTSYVDIARGRHHVIGGHWGSPARPNRQQCVVFRADGDAMPDDSPGETARWCPSIHMPRWASRIRLQVTDVRLEHLHAVTDEDACAEGVLGLPLADYFAEYAAALAATPRGTRPPLGPSPRERFRALWAATYSPASWHANPLVWRVEFVPVTTP